MQPPPNSDDYRTFPLVNESDSDDKTSELFTLFPDIFLNVHNDDDDVPVLSRQSSTSSSSSSSSSSLDIGLGSRVGLFQYGILRTNCVDCLDRTNVGQFCYAKTVVVKQVTSSSSSSSSDIVLTIITSYVL